MSGYSNRIMKEKQNEAKASPGASKTQPRGSAGCATSVLAIIVFPTALGVALSYIVDKYDEYLYPSVEEQVLEERLGKAIDISLFDVGEERTKKVAQFKELYRDTQKNWDYFDVQFTYVNSIELNISHFMLGVGSVNPLTKKLSVSYNNSHCLLEPDELVHELAHLWHEDLREKDQFEQQWYALTGRDYVGCNYLKNPFCHIDNWDQHVKAVAAPTRYGAINSAEHIAETTSLVYLLNDPFVQYGLSWRGDQGERLIVHVGSIHLPLENIPRIEQQIELLVTYSFFSEQEKDKALQNLELLKKL